MDVLLGILAIALLVMFAAFALQAMSPAYQAWLLEGRSRRAESVATREGLRYTEGEHVDLTKLPLPFLLQAAPEFAELMSGRRDGVLFLAFTFRFSALVGSGLPPSPFFASADLASTCVITRVDADLPVTTISHETLGHWLLHLIHSDVELHDERFESRFRVRAQDAGFAERLVTPDMRAWLLSIDAHSAHPGFQAAGPWLLCFTRLQPPEQVPDIVGWLLTFRRLLSASLELPNPQRGV